MALTFDDKIVPRRGALATIRDSIARNELFAGLYILGCVNGLGGGIIQAASSGDWTYGIRNVSIFVWAAFIAGVSLFFQAKNDDTDKVTALDLAIGTIFLAAIVIPGVMSWIAITGLSFYIFLF